MITALAERHEHLAADYKVVVIGSGYGGSVCAARLSAAGHDTCLLERGREWIPGSFPDTAREMAANLRRKKRPLGLYEFISFADINVFQGNGLGGGSLINANVAIRPEEEFFQQYEWPTEIEDLIASGDIWGYFERVEAILKPGPHPGAVPPERPLRKVQAMDKHWQTLGPNTHFHPSLPLTVNFGNDPENEFGVPQAPCIDCGDCFTGCNVRAKKTLYMNYLPLAKQSGARIFTQIEARVIEKIAGDRWRVEYVRRNDDKTSEKGSLTADHVVLAAGSLGSTELLLRSRDHGLSVSGRLGEGFSGNGDFYAVSYNGDDRTDIMGFGDHLHDKRAAVKAGPSIISAIQYGVGEDFDQQFIVEDATLPRAAVKLVRKGLKIIGPLGKNIGKGDLSDKLERWTRDFRWDPDGGLNHTMVYLVMGAEGDLGTMTLHPKKDVIDVEWKDVAKQPVFDRMSDALREHARTLKGNYVRNLNRIIEGEVTTVHPLGGCGMAPDASKGVVDGRGRVFDDAGGVHEGLYVADGAVLPGPIGVNPFLTIAALAEHIAEQAADRI